MADTVKLLETVREAGDITLKILDIGFEAASYGCPENDEGVPLLEEDTRYWGNFSEMRGVLEDYGEVEVVDDFLEEDQTMGLRATKTVDGEPFSHFNLSYGADGGNVIVVEFRMNGRWNTVIDHHSPELTPVQVGRYVARAELSILASQFGSSTETLDYWMIEASDYHDSEFTQSRWARTRDVSKQAVSKNVNSAKEVLNQG